MTEAANALRETPTFDKNECAGSILIIEDDYSASSAFALQAEHAGYSALHAGTIAEATELLQENRVAS